MVEAFARALPEVRVRRSEGGYFLWVELPEGVSGEAVAAAAVRHGVEVSAGWVCFPNEDPGNFPRLAFSFVGPDAIREGIGFLAKAYREVA